MEQTRTIQSLQSQKQYKSPFSWYNVVAGMLAKVIDDEERQSCQLHEQEMTSAVRSLSSDSIKTSQERKRVSPEAKYVEIHPCNNVTGGRMISKRSKSQEKPFCLDGKRNSTGETITKEKREKRVKYVPCPSFRPKKNDSRDQEIDELLYYKPTRDVESQEIGKKFVRKITLKRNMIEYE